MNRCVLRGECSLIRVGGGRPGVVSLTDSAVSVREAVVRLPGIARGVRVTRSAQVDLYVDRVTALFGSALLDIGWKESAGERPPLPLSVGSYFSVFVNAEDAVLVRMRGGDREADYLDRLNWDGDANEYLLSGFWRITASTPDIPNPAETFEQWSDLTRRSVYFNDEDARQRGVQLPADYRVRFPSEVLPETLDLSPGDGAAADDTPADGPVGAPTGELPRPADQSPPVRRAAALR